MTVSVQSMIIVRVSELEYVTSSYIYMFVINIYIFNQAAFPHNFLYGVDIT